MSFSRSLKEKSTSLWEEGYHHPFVQELGRGTLDIEKFKFYLIQDYHYLLMYAKVFALGAYKSPKEEWMLRFSSLQHSTLALEMDLHRAYMKEFGITPEAVLETKPSLFNRTYTANMITVGELEDLAALIAAVFPCAWTYAEYAGRLKEEYSERLSENPYRSWIEMYSSKEFAESFEWMYEVLDQLCEGKTTEELSHIEEVFKTSLEFEYLFWDMAYHRQMSYK